MNFSRIIAFTRNNRQFSTTTIAYKRKTLEPYDKRWGLHVTQAGPENPEGTLELKEKLLKSPNMPCRPYIFLKDGRSIFVKEMIPEFVVPDLTGFKLKPYVSYGVKDITQTEFTAKELFDATYGQELINEYTSNNKDMDLFKAKIEEFNKK